MFLTNGSPDICVLTLCITFRKNNLFLEWLPGISVNLNENYRCSNLQALASIEFLESSQPYLWYCDDGGGVDDDDCYYLWL